MSTQVIVTVNPRVFSLIGMGPLTVQIENGQGVYIAYGASQPSASNPTLATENGGVVNGADNIDFLSAQQVWAMPIPGAVNTSVTLGVTYDVGNYAGAAQVIAAPGTALPVGAATQATLASIDTKTPALGQATPAASMPVVLATTGSGATPPVVGTVASEDIALASIVDSSNALYVYFCEALPGALTSAAAWRCSRLTVATGQLMWANLSTGTGAMGSFKDIADNRATLVYA